MKTLIKRALNAAKAAAYFIARENALMRENRKLAELSRRLHNDHSEVVEAIRRRSER